MQLYVYKYIYQFFNAKMVISKSIITKVNKTSNNKRNLLSLHILVIQLHLVLSFPSTFFTFLGKYSFIWYFNLSIFYIKKSGYKPTTDQDFQMYLDEIRPQIAQVPLSEKISTLAR